MDLGILGIECFKTKWYYFFFQAEDGIRDGRVTGVQTCALPIYTLKKWLGRGAYLLVGASKFMRFAPFRCIIAINGQETSLDWKSTRLNSSHPSISYAVFCLKKKTRPSPWSLTTTTAF